MKNKKIIIIIVIVFLFIISISFSIFNIGNDKILNNISIEGIDISGKTQQEALDEITEVYNKRKEQGLILEHNDFNTQISYDQINVTEKIGKAVDEAYLVGRSGNIITNNYTIMFRFLFHKNYEIGIEYNKEELKDEIDDIETKLPDVEKEYSYYIEGDNLIINKGEKGVKIKKEELQETIEKELGNIKSESNKIDIPVYEEEPKPIDVEKIENEIKKEPVDAYISENPKEVHAEKNGIEFAVSIEEAKEIIKEEKEEYIIPLKIIQPSITVANLGEDAFANRLSTYTTNYDASNVNRNNNLNLAAEKLNGTIVNPGEEFSYNKTIGQRTIAAGFKEAHAYAGGKVVLDVGGGICQLSSTLYNAVLLINAEVTERHNHYFKTAYVPAGQDATVSWGSADFRFKNNRKYPIKIIAVAEDGVVRVDLMGIKQEDDCTVLIESKTVDIIKKDTEYRENNNLEKGESVVIQDGEDGYISETYKTLMKNGIIISKELVSKDSYNSLTQIIERNT